MGGRKRKELKKRKEMANAKSPMERERERERERESPLCEAKCFCNCVGDWWCGTSTKFLTFSIFLLLCTSKY